MAAQQLYHITVSSSPGTELLGTLCCEAQRLQLGLPPRLHSDAKCRSVHGVSSSSRLSSLSGSLYKAPVCYASLYTQLLGALFCRLQSLQLGPARRPHRAGPAPSCVQQIGGMLTLRRAAARCKGPSRQCRQCTVACP